MVGGARSITLYEHTLLWHETRSIDRQRPLSTVMKFTEDVEFEVRPHTCWAWHHC